jgi:DNA-binding NarL/FixJ family response regulator
MPRSLTCCSGLDLTVSLSKRRTLVLRLLQDGLTSKEIARVLGVAPFTVTENVHTLRRALGARTRAHLVALGIHRGFLRWVGASGRQAE